MRKSNDTQIKSPDGQWATVWPSVYEKGWRRYGEHWLPEDFVKKLIKAAAGAPAGSELARCAALLKTAAFAKGGELILPYGSEEEKVYKRELGALNKKIEKDPRSVGIYERDRESSEFQGQVERAAKRLRERLAPTKPQRWVTLPASPHFSADPGKASKYEGDAAREIIEAAKTLTAISQLLGKASAQARALGADFKPWETPKKKFPQWAERLSLSEPVIFNAAEVYAQRSCFAIYLQNGEHSGFVSTRKDIKPDLGSARLFPDEAMAEAFIKASYASSSCAVVAVDIAPKSYKPVNGKKAGYPELDAVIAGKEAAELDAMIKGARIQVLEAELARRQAEAGDGPKPAVKRARL